MSEERLTHTFAVDDLAQSLGKRFGLDTEGLHVAALFHDVMRETSPDELLRYCIEHRLDVLDIEKDQPMLLHGPVAADKLRTLFPDTPDTVLSAIRWHTIASPAMGPMGYVIYIADYLEPNRTHVRDDQRKDILDSPDLEQMMRKILDLTIPYLLQQNHAVPDVTLTLLQHISLYREVPHD